jgi:hypothetical protein
MISQPFVSVMRALGPVLVLVVLLAALPVAAQLPTNVPVVGWLVFEAGQGGLDGFRQGLRELGYVEGRNIAIESRSPKGAAIAWSSRSRSWRA